MSRVAARFLSLAWAALLLFPPLAAAQMTRGAISGTVRDATGALVPGATVTVTNHDTNQSRSAFSDANGFYRVPALEPGTYTIRTELSGFKTVEVKDVRLVAASEATINVDMKVAGVGEAITVLGQAESADLNKTNGTVGATVLERQVVELPLSADRNVNNLIATSPNVSRVAGQGTYAANGQRSRNNNYMIDGSDNNDISVTIATTQVVPESVAEFQVQTNSYSVEFGRNSGLQVNVITKSGSNKFHGQAWDYYRTNDLVSMTNIEKASGLTKPPDYTRHQLGADLGGPIIKDKTFFFLLYQRDWDDPAPNPGATTRIPTPAGFAALSGVPLRAGQPTSSRQAVLDQLRFLNDVYAGNPTFRNLNTTLVNGVPIETGQTNINIVNPSTYHSFNARIDHRLTANDNLTLRYYLNKRVDENAISNCVFGEIFCGNQDLKDQNLALSHTHIFGPTVVNEFRFSWVQRDLLFPENDPNTSTAPITGLFQIGGNNNFPQSRVTDSYQFSNVATWNRGKHTLKFGADLRYNTNDNKSSFDIKGTFNFNSLQDFLNNTAATFTQPLQTGFWYAKQWQTYFFVQDDFRPTPDLTINLGLRYEWSDTPLGFFGQDDPAANAALVPKPAKADGNNWAPRVGFAWSPRSSNSLLGDGKTVFRGGFGMGYDVLFYNILTVNTNPNVALVSLNNLVDVYPQKLPASGSAASFNPLNSYTNSPENIQAPDAKYWSVSVGREIGDFTVEVGYTGSKGGHGVNQIHMNPGILTPEQAALVAATQNVNAIPGVQARRLYPQYGVRTSIPAYVGPGGNDVEGRSSYNGVYASVNKRLRHGVQFGLSYTHSRFESNNDASLGETGTDGSSQRPQSFFDYDAEWSVSQFDIPNRFVANYLWEIPGPKSGFLKQVLGGWQVSGITAYQSGRPFTVFIGVDSNGDGTTGSDRPNITGACGVTWDADHRGFTNDGCYVAPLGTNNLPLQNGLGNGNAPRNGERSAGFWNTDLSLMKRFYMFGDKQLQIRADAFNAFNQDNYGIPTANMNSPSFGQNPGTGQPGQSNGWGRRIVTLSAKFTF